MKAVETAGIINPIQKTHSATRSKLIRFGNFNKADGGEHNVESAWETRNLQQPLSILCVKWSYAKLIT